MKKSLKITITGKVQQVGYREFAHKHAQTLQIEGTIQNSEDGNVVIFASGSAENLDAFLDLLYKGPTQAKVTDLSAEPMTGEKDFRGVFRIIGE